MDRKILADAIKSLKTSLEFMYISEVIRQIALEVPCEECDGRGYLTGATNKKYSCEKCHGSGCKYGGI